jgi:uncharacterized membrane protein YkgB
MARVGIAVTRMGLVVAVGSLPAFLISPAALSFLVTIPECRAPPLRRSNIRAIPGVVGIGLFLGMADTVLVGDRNDFRMIEERQR